MRLGGKKFWKRVSVSVVSSFVLFLAVVTGLVLFSPTAAPARDGQSLDFGGLGTDQGEVPRTRYYQARDGQRLPYRYYDGQAGRALILLHGSAYHNRYLAPLARYLAEQNVANVYTPDLRGHGPQAPTKGNIDYIGQLEDDVADLVEYVRQQEGDGPIFLGGHSSGGGTAIRYAGDASAAAVDGYLLLAPYIHHNAPTFPESGSGWTNVNTPRIVGLSILNSFGITVLNDRDVISFNMPAAYRDGTETLRYSYKLQVSMHPRGNYAGDIASLPENTLVLVGAADETFDADAYQPLFAEHAPAAEVRVLEDTSHFGVVTGRPAHEAVAGWLEPSQ